MKNKLIYSVAIGAVIIAALSYFSPVIFLAVSGHSMEPTIRDGDAIIILPVGIDEIEEGDIISFEVDGLIVTHRVIGFENKGVRTKGDNLQEIDSFIIEPSQIIGKHFLTLPHLGVFVRYAGSPWAFVILLLIPVSIIVYTESRKIRESLRREKHICSS